MVKRNYVGVSNPEGEFNELRDAHARLRRMQLVCTPFSADYVALQAVLAALRDAATHFHQEPVLLRWQAALGRSVLRDGPRTPTLSEQVSQRRLTHPDQDN